MKIEDLANALEKKNWGKSDHRSFKNELTLQAQELLNGFAPIKRDECESNPIQVLDFFSGAGGTSLGFASINKVIPAFRMLGGCDVNAVSANTYSRNFGTKAINEDITKLVTEEKLKGLLEQVGYDSTLPLIMIGCAPCQGFSSHRKKHWNEEDDIRNSLVMSFAEIVKIIQPDVIVMENVPEFLSARYWKYFLTAKQNYENNGYIVKADIYNAAAFGVPQERFRSIIIGMKKEFLMPTGHLAQGKYRTVRDAIATLPVLKAGDADKNDAMHKSIAHKQSTINVIKQVPHDGGSRPAGVGPKCLEKISGFSDVYGRLAWDKPSITITHYARNPASGRYCHPEQDRGLTAREAAILQSFPNGFEFTGKSDDIYRQIGEAVPPMLSTAIAANILIEMISAEPTREKIEASPSPILEPVSSSYSSVIAGIKNKGKVVGM